MSKTISILVFLFCVPLLRARSLPKAALTPEQRTEVTKIALSIRHVRPGLSAKKYTEYAIGIYRASKRYQIEPNLLIAIAQQETTFRENLPEGKAGEIGICQIRKMWLNQPKFQMEFKTATVKDLMNPEKSFLFAAWLLSDLKKSVKNHTIPYWSYYNAVRFNPRLRYFVSVNRFLAALKTGSRARVLVASGEMDDESAPPWIPEHRFGSSEQNNPLQNRNAAFLGYKYSTGDSSPRLPAQSSNSGWITSALRRLHGQNIKNAQANEETISPSITRAAIELNIPNLFNALPVLD